MTSITKNHVQSLLDAATPGEWREKDRDTGIIEIFSGNKEDICLVNTYEVSYSLAESKANAALIAAAPTIAAAYVEQCYLIERLDRTQEALDKGQDILHRNNVVLREKLEATQESEKRLVETLTRVRYGLDLPYPGTAQPTEIKWWIDEALAAVKGE